MYKDQEASESASYQFRIGFECGQTHGTRSRSPIIMEIFEYCTREFGNYSKRNSKPLKQGKDMIKLYGKKKILIVICKLA